MRLGLAKRAQLIALAFLVAACTTAPAAGKPTPSPSTPPQQTVIPDTDPLGYMHMTSLDVMWAGTANRILRSSDRGRHWAEITPSNLRSFQSPFVLDDKTAWLVSSSPGSRDYTMLQTSDGGRSWTNKSGHLAAGWIGSVMFVDAIHGWATVSRGAAAGSESIAVLRSIDGGATWTQVAETSDPTTGAPSPSGLEFSCDKGMAVFGSQTFGLLPNICAGGPATIYRSRDGGSHWALVTVPTFGPQAYFNEPVFLSSTYAFTVGRFGDVTNLGLLITSDGGYSWRLYPTPGQGSVDFESTSSGWQLDSPIQATTDGGMTWHSLSAPPPPFKPTDMALQYLGRGTALAWSYAAAYRTDDGGTTWQNVTPPKAA